MKFPELAPPELERCPGEQTIIFTFALCYDTRSLASLEHNRCVAPRKDVPKQIGRSKCVKRSNNGFIVSLRERKHLMSKPEIPALTYFQVFLQVSKRKGNVVEGFFVPHYGGSVHHLSLRGEEAGACPQIPPNAFSAKDHRRLARQIGGP